MRRALTMLIASSLLALALPAAASAHNARAHHHHRRHHRAHTVVFSPAAAPSNTPSPAAEGEPAGTIASYEGGVLTITLVDGSTVSGKVTEATFITCGCPGHDGSPGGWQGGYYGHGQGDYQPGPGPQQYQHGYRDADFQESSSCGVSSLVAGAKVKQAELSIGSAGAVWKLVDLEQS